MSIPTFAALYGEYGVTGPHELFTRMREEQPVSRLQLPNGVPVWLVTRHADVRAALGDARLSCFTGTRVTAQEVLPAEIRASMGSHMLRMDGADHTRLRRLVSPVFTARRVEKLRPMIQKKVGDLLDALASAENPDVIHDLAYPLPMQVICELLGVPLADRDRFRPWADAYLTGIGTQNFAVDAVTEFVLYLRELVERKRAEPDGKLLSAIIYIRDNEDRLTEDELISMCLLLIIAGFETAANLIGNGTHLLLADPDLAARLRADHEAIPAAVEEFLRFESPVSSVFRVAAEDVELAGETIREGEVLLISLLSANRDEKTFEDPHRLNTERVSREHVAFGYGIHYCLGVPLARMQAQLAFAQMLDRFPKMRRVDPAVDLKWRPGFMIHGLTELPVVLDG